MKESIRVTTEREFKATHCQQKIQTVYLVSKNMRIYYIYLHTINEKSKQDRIRNSINSMPE